MKLPASIDAILLLAFVLVALVSMVVYAHGGASRDPGHQAKETHLFLGVGDFLLHWLIWVLEPPLRLSIRFGITPDQHSYLATAIRLSSAAAMTTGHLSLGGWTLGLSGVIDTLAGHLARRTGQSSKRGDFIDG